MTLYVGCDLGTSTIKVTCGDTKFLIPSLIGEPNPGWTGGTLDQRLETNLIIVEGNDEWYVGELARTQSEVKRALAADGQMKSAEETFMALKAALALLVDKDGEELVVAVRQACKGEVALAVAMRVGDVVEVAGTIVLQQ